MNKLILSVAVAVAMLVVFAMMYLQRQTVEPEAVDKPVEFGRQDAPVAEQKEAVIRYPVPKIVPQGEDQTPEDVSRDVAIQVDRPDEEAPLPTLDDSDAQVKEAIAAFASGQSLQALFRMDGFIRRLVVTIDNLPQKQLPRAKYRVTRSTGGRFAVQQEGENLYLSPENFERYAPVVGLIESLDNDSLIAVYLQYYPLFQEAYEYLGYPSAYFNDRLIDVIDHLLAAPVVDGPIRLVRPHVLYKYADPDLETLSAGHKALLRIGPENANRVKTKLREVRQMLTGQGEAEELSKEIETGIDLFLNEDAEKTGP
ncbi:MAG: DUF3014 domain-containing protein [Thiogranum sp.]